MIDPDAARRAYERELMRAARDTIRTLERELGLAPRQAGEIYAVTAALVPGGLARHTRRRPQNARAAFEVVKKFGRPADVDMPELGIAGRLQKPRLSPRLGGLLGEAGPRAAVWLAERTGADVEVVGRAIAAIAPIALGALERALEPRDLSDWIATLPDEALTKPTELFDANALPSQIYRRVRRLGQPLWIRALGIEG